QRWLGRDGLVVLDECVPGHTRIATPAGERQIQDLKVGDLVLGYNHDTGRVEPTAVHHVFRRQTSESLTRVQSATMTGNHPVWTQGRGYVRADSLRPNDQVVILEGGYNGGNPNFHLRVVRPDLHAEGSTQPEAEGTEAAFLQHVMFR